MIKIIIVLAIYKMIRMYIHLCLFMYVHLVCTLCVVLSYEACIVICDAKLFLCIYYWYKYMWLNENKNVIVQVSSHHLLCHHLLNHLQLNRLLLFLLLVQFLSSWVHR